jgi:dihydropteroate synthase
VLEGLAGRTRARLSIDTTKAEVAAQALAAGAEIVNDISAGDGDERMWSVVAEAGCEYVLMHRQGAPATMQVAPREPLMVEDEAMQHPQFKYFPEAGEEPYESFLGVPIGWKSQLEGVLVVQTIEAREYTPAEIRMLSLAADLMAPALRNLPLNVLRPGKAKTAGKA